MKLCLTYVKTLKKPPKCHARREFIKHLIKVGMPENLQNVLIDQNYVTWEKADIDSNTIFAAEIIDQDLPCYESDDDNTLSITLKG